jgi:hypothetical protein
LEVLAKITTNTFFLLFSFLHFAVASPNSQSSYAGLTKQEETVGIHPKALVRWGDAASLNRYQRFWQSLAHISLP